MKSTFSLLFVAAAAASFFSGTVAAFGQSNIATWELTSAPGNEASLSGTGSSNVTANALTRGSGLTGTAASNSLNTAGWNSEATDYISFGVTVANGYQASLGSLYIGTRSSPYGPGSIGLYTSQDNFTNAISTITETLDGSGNAQYVDSIIDLSTLTPFTGTLSFELKEIGTGSANGKTTTTSGTFRVSDYYANSAYSPVSLTGSVAVIPEPSTYAAIVGALALGFVAWKRRR